MITVLITGLIASNISLILLLIFLYHKVNNRIAQLRSEYEQKVNKIKLIVEQL